MLKNTYDEAYLDTLLADLEKATASLQPSSASLSRSSSIHLHSDSAMNSSYSSASFERTPRRLTTNAISARFEYTKPREEPLYQNDSFSQSYSQKQQYEVKQQAYQPPPPLPSPVYAKPNKPFRSQSPLPPPPPPVVLPARRTPPPPTNYNDLDTLLDDLTARPQPARPTKVINTSHYTRVGPVGEPNGKVDGLISHLERNLNDPQDVRKYKGEQIKPITMTEYYEKKQTNDQYIQPNIRVERENIPRASNATHELDDLMASLSNFKVTNGQSTPIETTNSSTTAYRTSISKSQKMSSEHADYAVCTPKDQRDSAKKLNTPIIEKNSQFEKQSETFGNTRGHTQNMYENQASVQQQIRVLDKQVPLESILGSIEMELSREGVDTAGKGICAACDKPIAGQVLSALGNTYHPQHFTCAHCACELGEKAFFERDGRCYCEADYEHLFAPRCAFCAQPIVSGQSCVAALEQHYHAEHFFCADCGSVFSEDCGYHAHEGAAYCEHCYLARFANKCADCQKPITSSFISALGAQWHVACFVCAECRCEFAAGAFFELEGRPYCETHFHARKGTLCAGCHAPITGRCVTAMYRKFHPEHFVCSFCLKQLNKGTFKEQNDKPYCHGCFDKLFG